MTQHPSLKKISLVLIKRKVCIKYYWLFNFVLPSLSIFSQNKITEATQMPIGKQKLQVDGIFTKDSNTLAFYNVMNGAEILLSQKERGGRKK